MSLPPAAVCQHAELRSTAPSGCTCSTPALHLYIKSRGLVALTLNPWVLPWSVSLNWEQKRGCIESEGSLQQMTVAECKNESEQVVDLRSSLRDPLCSFYLRL